MATARKSYTSEYSYEFAPKTQPERVKRTRQRPEKSVEKQPKQQAQSGTLPLPTLRILVAASIAIGIMFIGIVLVNAQAAKLQYSINQLKSQNTTIQGEIDMLEIKIDGSTGISQLENYAVADLGMHYPQGSECIHLGTVTITDESLSDIIKQKAYE